MNNLIHHKLDSPELIYSWKSLLSYYSLEKIHQAFDSYQFACLRDNTNFSLIERQIESLLNVDVRGHQFYPNFKYSMTVPFHPNDFPNYCFRIRKITKRCIFDVTSKGPDFETMEFEEMQTDQDAWERPANLVTTYQRLNKPNESVLYTSLMSSTAVLETDLQEKDMFFLIVYKNKKAFRLSDCCKFLYFDELTEEENMKRYILFSFLRNEFIRILPGAYDEGIQYCSSYNISRKFFIDTEQEVAGIQFPSTRGLGHRNVAFWGNCRDNLALHGLRLCRLSKRQGTQSGIDILADCFWNDETKRYMYVSPSSEKSKQIFGDPYLSVMMFK